MPNIEKINVKTNFINITTRMNPKTKYKQYAVPESEVTLVPNIELSN